MTTEPVKPVPAHTHSSDESCSTAFPHSAAAALNSSPDDEESTMISLAGAVEAAEEVLKDYRKQMLALSKQELHLFSDEMQQMSRGHAVHIRSAIEADLRNQRSERTKHWFFDALLVGSLFVLSGPFMALMIFGFLKLFETFSEGG